MRYGRTLRAQRRRPNGQDCVNNAAFNFVPYDARPRCACDKGITINDRSTRQMTAALLVIKIVERRVVSKRCRVPIERRVRG